MRPRFPALAFAALIALAAVCAAAPSAHAEATRRPLTDGWRFQLDPRGHCEAVANDDPHWQSVRLPHTWNDLDTFDEHVGYARERGCYRIEIESRADWAGKLVRLRFLGAYASARVWLDGRELGRFDGDFTGFHADVPADQLLDGGRARSVRVDVEVDNRASKNVLPGRPDPDYNLYGGLYREAYLEVLDPLHVEPEVTFARPAPMNEGVWLVPVTVGLANAGAAAASAEIELELSSPDGGVVAHGAGRVEVPAGGTARLVVDLGPLDHPALWSPAAPALHEVRVRLRRGVALGDEHRFAIGLRTARFDAERGFLLNGVPLELRGGNRHQDFPGMGSAMPAGFQELDVRVLKAMGANFVRTSHYPQHPAFLDACDRLGVVVFEEVATWKTVGGTGFQDAAARMMQAMIERDRNHPSIVLWGMMNEGRSAPMFERLKKIAAELDPTRGVGYAEHRFERALSQKTAALADAIGLNYRPEKLTEFKKSFPAGAFFVSEHTNRSHTTRGDLAAELIQVRFIDADLDTFAALPWLGGHALWSLHDYGTERPGKKTRTVHTSGAVDAARVPRASARYLATRWSDTPRVEVLTPPVTSEAFAKTKAPGGGEPLAAGSVVVPIATNCAGAVTLVADGTERGSKPGKPLLEWTLAAAPQRVDVRAECAGGRVTEAHWEKPGAGVRVRLTSDIGEVPRDGSNAALVSVRVEDAAGRLASDWSGDVIVTTTRAGRAITIGGRGRVPIAGGLGAFAVESAAGAARDASVRVIATQGGLTPANLVLPTR